MSDINGIGQCGQYPASLFKSPLELQGSPVGQTQKNSEAGYLAEDKVTLSADAVALAKAELQANTSAVNQISNLGNSSLANLQNPGETRPQERSSFYTKV